MGQVNISLCSCTKEEMEPSTEAYPRFENYSQSNTRLVDLPDYLDQIFYLSVKAEKIQSVWKGFKTRKQLVQLKLDKIKEQHMKSQRGECLRLNDGSLFTGKCQDGKRQGPGVQEWPDGTYFKGEWSENKACRFGYFCNANGDSLQGWWVNDKSNGKGLFKYTSGNYYDGDWKNNKRTGFAVERAGNSVYKGFFRDGLKHGFGIQQWKEGNQYTGNWEDDQMQGFGTYKWADGTIFTLSLIHI